VAIFSAVHVLFFAQRYAYRGRIARQVLLISPMAGHCQVASAPSHSIEPSWSVRYHKDRVLIYSCAYFFPESDLSFTDGVTGESWIVRGNMAIASAKASLNFIIPL